MKTFAHEHSRGCDRLSDRSILSIANARPVADPSAETPLSGRGKRRQPRDAAIADLATGLAGNSSSRMRSKKPDRPPTMQRGGSHRASGAQLKSVVEWTFASVLLTQARQHTPQTTKTEADLRQIPFSPGTTDN